MLIFGVPITKTQYMRQIEYFQIAHYLQIIINQIIKIYSYNQNRRNWRVCGCYQPLKTIR
jgi:hypothetical protein